MRLGFRFKLLLVFITLLGVTLIAILYAVLQATDRKLEINAVHELQVAERVLQTLLNENTRQLSDRVRLLAKDFGFKKAVATRENDTIASVLANHGKRINADMVILLSPSGDIIVSTHSNNALIMRLSRDIGLNQKDFSVLTLAEGQPYQLVMVPVYAPDLIAWVGLGFVIDQSLIESFKSITGVDISFVYVDKEQTTAGSISTLPEALRPELVLKDQLTSGQIVTDALQQAGWISEQVDLFEHDLSRDGMMLTTLLSLDLQRALAAYAPLRWQIIAIILVALLIAVIMVMIFAGNITRPIEILTQASRRIADGHYHSRINLNADNEFGVLSKALNNMQDAIFDREQQMKQAQMELRLAQKLEAVGQLAAGISHEINTPMQFIGDHVDFLKTSYEDLEALLSKYGELREQLKGVPAAESQLAELEKLEDQIDLPFLQKKCPEAFVKTQAGVERVSKIVQAMKEFAYPSQEEKSPADINQAIENTLTVAKNEYKYIADVEIELQPLPPVQCHIGDLNQVFLNLIVNAAHAIEAANRNNKSKGLIRITSLHDNNDVEIRIADSGTGIPEEVQPRIFDPFFTTKEIGKGSGQGLAIARSIITEKHNGSMIFETQPGKGTTFIIRLPVNGVG